jgi:hypothetical protein
MSENQPLVCDQCGKPISEGEPNRLALRANEEVPGGAEGRVVHRDCWPAWAEAHGVEEAE